MLEAVISKAALTAFVQGGGLSRALANARLAGIAAQIDAIHLARDRQSYFWTIITQLQSALAEAETDWKCTGFRDQFRVRRESNSMNLMRNIRCFLAVCYKYIGEKELLEAMLERLDHVPDLPDPSGMRILATLGAFATGFAQVTILGDALFGERMPVIIEDLEQFRDRLRSMDDITPDFDAFK